MFLNNGFPADVRDASNRSPLFLAAVGGDSKVVSLLLSLNNIGTDPAIGYNRTRLAPLAGREHKHGVPVLVLPKNVDLEDADVLTNATPSLQIKGYENQAAPRTALTLETVGVNCQDDYGYTPLMIASCRGHDEMVAQLLKQVNILVNLVCETSEPRSIKVSEGPFRAHSWTSHHKGWGFEMGKDTVCGTESEKRWTPLIAAASYKHDRMVKLLLAHHSVDVNYKDIYGRTVLWFAARNGNAVIVTSLLDFTGIDLDSVGEDGHTALSQAAYGWLFGGMMGRKNLEFTQHEATVRILLTRTDIDIECVDEKGNNLWSRATIRAKDT